MSVHPSSVIEEGAVIGAGVEIGPFCHVGPRVVLEEGVRLRSHVSLTGITHVGARCDLYPGVALGGDGQIRGNDFTEGRLEIGPDCVLREMVSMHLGSRKGGGAWATAARRPCRSRRRC